jgi:uncharacterized tellurite resistance protein B-like protein
MCDDLLSTAEVSWADACQVEPQTLATLMAEIDDSEMRLEVLSLCVAVVEADGLVAEGESIVLETAVEQWGLQRWMLRPELSRRSAEHV